MNRILKNNLWWIVPVLFMIMAISEILVAYFTIGRKYITEYFAIIEVILSLFLVAIILYCLIKKGTRFRIWTIMISLIMLASLVYTFFTFSFIHAIACPPLNKYLTFGQSAAFWYRIDIMETDRALQSGVYHLYKSEICVNINFIVAIVIGVATLIIFINQILRRKNTQSTQKK